MKALKIVGILFAVYVAIVALFETWLGYNQPANASTMVITTTDAKGNQSDRVVVRIESEGQLYAAANHWPRAWYNAVLTNPEVQVSTPGGKQSYRAVPVTGEEFDRAAAARPLGPVFRILTGFPPRRIVRLDPA